MACNGTNNSPAVAGPVRARKRLPLAARESESSNAKAEQREGAGLRNSGAGNGARQEDFLTILAAAFSSAVAGAGHHVRV